MKKIARIIDDFDKGIINIRKSNLNKLSKLKENIKIAKLCIQQLRIVIRESGFSSKREEITFFKYQKPYVQGRLNFFLKLNTFLLEFPEVGIIKQRNFINKELSKLEIKKSHHIQFVKYYKLDEYILDHIYFLRGKNQSDLFIDMNYHCEDLDFSTSHDHLATKIITRDLLLKFYAKELERLNSKDPNIVIEEVKPAIFRDLSWNGSKTDLIELVYALHTSGVIRNGKPEIKKNVRSFL